MKEKIIDLIFFLVSISLGFVMQKIIPLVDISIYEFVGILCVAYALIYNILMLTNVIDDCDLLVEYGFFGAYVSIIGGSYYYVSEGLRHWIIGLFPTFGIFIIVSLIMFVINWFFELIGDIQMGSSYRSSGSGSYYDGASYGSSNSNSRGKSYSGDDLSVTYFEDKFGNTTGKATTHSVGGKVKEYSGIDSYTEFKDNYGQSTGSATTYDLGFGIKKTIYKDKDGKESESTHYNW